MSVSGPYLAQDLQVFPIERVVLHLRAAHRRGSDLVLDLARIVLVARHARRHDVAREHTEEPARMHQHVGDVLAGEGERNGESVTQVVFAVGRDGAVHGDDQGFEPCRSRAFHELVRHRLVGPHVELEPQPPACFGGDAFHGRHRSRCEAKRNTGCLRRARERDLAFVPHEARRAGRRNADRHLLRVSE